MWDNAIRLKKLANMLMVLSTLAVVYGVAYYLMHLPELLPLRSVRLSTIPQRVSAADLLQVVRSEARGNLLTVDIERLRLSLEKLPWMRSVSIRREFPYALVVQLEEQQALARWNGSALVNQQGEVFVAESDQALPSFTGENGSSAEMVRHYAQFSQQLAGLGLSITEVALSPRHAWQLRLSNGMVLALGHDDMEQRLAKFVAVYPYAGNGIQKTGRVGAATYVDLRYHNGFAVRQVLRGGERGMDQWATS